MLTPTSLNVWEIGISACCIICCWLKPLTKWPEQMFFALNPVAVCSALLTVLQETIKSMAIITALSFNPA